MVGQNAERPRGIVPNSSVEVSQFVKERFKNQGIFEKGKNAIRGCTESVITRWDLSRGFLKDDATGSPVCRV